MSAEEILGLLHEIPAPAVITDAHGIQVVKVHDDPYVEQYYDVAGRPDFRKALRLTPPLTYELPSAAVEAGEQE